MKRHAWVVGCVLGSLLLIACGADAAENVAKNAKPEYEDCSSAKEFLTTWRYLQDGEHSGLTPADALNMSLKVAQGCSGAAERFIRTFKLLSKAGIVHGEAVTTAADMASRKPDTAKTFDGVFKRCFAEDGLDLDLASARQFARQVAFDYEGEKKWAAADFSEVAEFLIGAEGGTMPRPEAALIASRVVRAADVHQAPIADRYRASVIYLQGDRGPDLVASDARALAETLLFIGPEALANFQDAFAFAVAPRGLKKERSDAVKIALDVAKLSRRAVP